MINVIKIRITTILLTVFVTVLASDLALAQVVSFDNQGSDGSWHNAINWATRTGANTYVNDNPVPGSGNTVIIGDGENATYNNKSAIYSNGTTSIGSLAVGTRFVDPNIGIGSLTLTGGSLSTSTSIAIGSFGGSGTLNVIGGTLTSGTNFLVGQTTTSGNATIRAAASTNSGAVFQTGGVVNVTGNLNLVDVAIGNTNKTVSANYTIDGSEFNAPILSVTGTLYNGNQILSVPVSNAMSSEFKVIGSGADISAGAYVQRSHGDLEFVFDLTGITAIEVAGNITLAGTLTLDMGVYTGPFQEFVLLDGSETTIISGIWDDVIFGETSFFDGNNNEYELIQRDGDIVLVPEASSMALACLGGIGLLMMRRRRS